MLVIFSLLLILSVLEAQIFPEETSNFEPQCPDAPIITICEFYHDLCIDPETLEYICEAGEICCADGCGNSCQKPVYYNVSCPEDSILTKPDTTTSFCLEDCNCPDYRKCCPGPCENVNICRDKVLKKAYCPSLFCHGGNPCTSDLDCIYYNQLCCWDECIWGGNHVCTDPLFECPG